MLITWIYTFHLSFWGWIQDCPGKHWHFDICTLSKKIVTGPKFCHLFLTKTFFFRRQKIFLTGPKFRHFFPLRYLIRDLKSFWTYTIFIRNSYIKNQKFRQEKISAKMLAEIFSCRNFFRRKFFLPKFFPANFRKIGIWKKME